MDYTTCLPTLMLLAQAVFLLERGQTDECIFVDRRLPTGALYSQRVSPVSVVEQNSAVVLIVLSRHMTCHKAITCKHVGIHKTGSRQRIAALLAEDRSTGNRRENPLKFIVNMLRNFINYLTI